MWYLNGGDPLTHLGDNMRLALAGVGQCVAPLVGYWLAVQVREHLDGFLGLAGTKRSQELLKEYKQMLLRNAQKIWGVIADHAEQVSEAPASTMSQRDIVVVQVAGSPPVSVCMQLPCKVSSLTAAELRVEPSYAGFTVSDQHGNLLHPDSCILPGMSLWLAPIQGPETAGASASASHASEVREVRAEVSGADVTPASEDTSSPAETIGVHPIRASEVRGHRSESRDMTHEDTHMESPIHAQAHADPLVDMDRRSLLRITCPRVNTQHALDGLRIRTIVEADRVAVLMAQEGAWADDEMLYWLQVTADAVPEGEQVVVLDPLLVTSLVAHGDEAFFANMLSELEPQCTVITAVITEGHWLPLIWRLNENQVQGYTGGFRGPVPQCVQRFHDMVVDLRTQNTELIAIASTPVLIVDFCGAWAIAFIRHVLLAEDLPNTSAALETLNDDFKGQFINDLDEHPTRPWVWATGDKTARKALAALLREHGVPAEATDSRIDMLCQKLGEMEVMKAAVAPAAWKEL